jgi:hypothetical protein
MGTSTRLALLAAMAAMILSNATILAQGKKGNGTSYSITPLSAASGLVQCINSSGQMVGHQSPSGLPKATHWSLNNQGSVVTTVLDSTLMIDGFPVAFDSVADGNNDQGIIVGALGDYATQTGWRPVVWMSAQSAPRELPVSPSLLAVRVEGEAFGVSNLPSGLVGLKAVIVGRYIEYFGESEGTLTLTHAVAWGVTSTDQITVALELGVAASTAGMDEFESVAVDVNANLAVVGNIYPRAMRWQLGWNGAQLSLESALTLFPSLSFSQSSAINEFGDICGIHAPYSEAFLLENDAGTLVDRPLKQLVNNSREYSRSDRAAGLNSLPVPQVIGGASVYSTRSHILNQWVEVMWQGSSVIDLEKTTPSLEIEASYLTTINDAGWIAGQGWDGVRHRPVILKPQ